MHWVIRCDGASSPSEGVNGRAGAAFIATDSQNKQVQYKRFLRGTVNRAEVTAILLALEWAYTDLKDEDTLTICSDSQYAVYATAQKLGLEYLPHNVTNFFPEIFADIVLYYRRLGGGSRVSFEWVPRHENKDVDKLAKAAKDMEEK